MQISGREHQTLETTEKSVLPTQVKSRGPCPVCKQYFPQLKLGPFIKHRHNCNGNLSDRKVSCTPDISTATPVKKNITARSVKKYLRELPHRKDICWSTPVSVLNAVNVINALQKRKVCKYTSLSTPMRSLMSAIDIINILHKKVL